MWHSFIIGIAVVSKNNVSLLLFFSVYLLKTLTAIFVFVLHRDTACSWRSNSSL